MTAVGAYAWTVLLIARLRLRDPTFRGLLAGFALLVAWWAWAVPAPHGLRGEPSPWSPASWPRWLVYGTVFLALAARPVRAHPLTAHVGVGVVSWRSAALFVQACLALAAGQLMLTVAGVAAGAVFHVEPRALWVNGLATLAATGAGLALSMRIPRPGLCGSVFLGLVALGELALQRAGGAWTVAAGFALCGVSVALLLEPNGRRACRSRS